MCVCVGEWNRQPILFFAQHIHMMVLDGMDKRKKQQRATYA